VRVVSLEAPKSNTPNIEEPKKILSKRMTPSGPEYLIAYRGFQQHWKSLAQLVPKHQALVDKFEDGVYQKKMATIEQRKKEMEAKKQMRAKKEQEMDTMRKDPQKAIAEQKELAPFFELVNKDSNKCCYGVEDTVHAVEMGAVDVVFVWKYPVFD
jgi:hypothetical protein